MKTVTDREFKASLNSSKLVLVDFWAPWCGPCRQLTPVLEEVSLQMAADLEILKMNVDENVQVPAEFRVRSIPTLLLFKDGTKIDAKVGAQSKQALIAWINGHLATS